MADTGCPIPGSPLICHKGSGIGHPASGVNARVLLTEMFGYAADLKSMTQGRATYSMQSSGYEPVPQSIARTIKGKWV